MLAGKYQGGAWPPAARFSFYREFSPRTKVMTARFVNEQTLAATARFGELAKECGMSLPRFAIAWTLTRDFVGSTLVGATSPEQLDETLAAAEVTLPAGGARPGGRDLPRDPLPPRLMRGLLLFAACCAARRRRLREPRRSTRATAP